MGNIALGKPVIGDAKRSEIVTNGQIIGYSGNSGFADFHWPGRLTVDLESNVIIYEIRFLIWDGLGVAKSQRNPRIYKYRLLTSNDNNSWEVIYDTGDQGFNGWQSFKFPEGKDLRYIQIHGLWNSANTGFHIVEVEAYDDSNLKTSVEIVFEKTVAGLSNGKEIGDGLPLSSHIKGIIRDLEIFGKKDFVSSDHFSKLILQLRQHATDISALDYNMGSIRREIMFPVKRELKQLNSVGKMSFVVGVIGGLLAIFALIVGFMQ